MPRSIGVAALLGGRDLVMLGCLFNGTCLRSTNARISVAAIPPLAIRRARWSPRPLQTLWQCCQVWARQREHDRRAGSAPGTTVALHRCL